MTSLQSRFLRRAVAAIHPVLLFAVVALAYGRPAAADLHPACEPSAEVADILHQERALAARCGFSLECSERWLAVVEEALERFPGDLHLHRAFQDVWHPVRPLAVEHPEERRRILERYRQRAEAGPEDAAALYLRGRAEDDFALQRELFEQALEVDPRFPWSHLGMLYVLTREEAAGDGRSDTGAIRRHVAAFHDLCPTRYPEIADRSRRLGDDDLVRRQLDRSRAALEELGLGRAFDRYPSLWQNRFAVTPLGEHDGASETVRGDLQRIEALGLEQDPVWWETLADGYEILGEGEELERIADARSERWPCSSTSVQQRWERWSEEHPAPPPDATEEERTTHAQALWAVTGAWLERCPDDTLLPVLRLQAASELSDLPAQAVTDLADRLLEIQERGGPGTGLSAELMIARLYLRHEIRLDRVRELAERGLDRELDELEETLANPVFPAEMKERMAGQEVYLRWTTVQLATEAALALERLDEARELVLGLRSLADDHRPGEDASARESSLFQTLDGGYWSLRSKLAELEDRPVDAAAFLARAAAYLPEEARTEERVAEARQKWIDAGGSAESWQALIEGLRAGGSAAVERSAVAWSEEALPLPEFAVEALSGGTWQLADFRGKTVFANVWATWCGPCRQELPEVEELHERLAGRDDVLVVTLNIDANPRLAQRYVEEEGFTFPVLLAEDLVTELGRRNGIPRSWIIDPQGVIRREQVGFGSTEGWVDDVVDLLEGAAEGAGS